MEELRGMLIDIDDEVIDRYNYQIAHNEVHNHDTDLDWDKDEFDAGIAIDGRTIKKDLKIVDKAEALIIKMSEAPKPARGVKIERDESDSSFLSDDENLERDLAGYEFLDWVRPNKRDNSGPETYFNIEQSDVLDDVIADMR